MLLPLLPSDMSVNSSRRLASTAFLVLGLPLTLPAPEPLCDPDSIGGGSLRAEAVVLLFLLDLLDVTARLSLCDDEDALRLCMGFCVVVVGGKSKPAATSPSRPLSSKMAWSSSLAKLSSSSELLLSSPPSFSATVAVP